jgi:bifunctional DNA-binding transcriptional regulator/antitoxin component of YhaV-PrlF toxin-antitoxin module
MAIEYSTITKKGQVTLPVALRRHLGVERGQRVAFHAEAGRVVIEAAPSLDEARRRLRSEAEAAGTWAKPQDPADAWAGAAAEKVAKRGA